MTIAPAFLVDSQPTFGLTAHRFNLLALSDHIGKEASRERDKEHP